MTRISPPSARQTAPPSRPHRAPATMHARRFVGALATAFALALPAAPAGASVLDYARDRGLDLLDILRLRVVIPDRGEGWGLKARATSLVQVGYVHLDGTAYGMDQRGIGAVAEQRTEGGLSVFYWHKTRMTKTAGNDYLDPTDHWYDVASRGIIRNLPSWDDGRQAPDSIGAEIELGFIGFDIGVYPLQIIDFPLGFFGFDIYRDDQSYADDIPPLKPTLQGYKYAGTEPPDTAEEAIARARADAAGTSAAPATPETEQPSAPEPGETLPSDNAPAAPPATAEPTAAETSTLGSSVVAPDDVKSFLTKPAERTSSYDDTPAPAPAPASATPAPAPEAESAAEPAPAPEATAAPEATPAAPEPPASPTPAATPAATDSPSDSAGAPAAPEAP